MITDAILKMLTGLTWAVIEIFTSSWNVENDAINAMGTMLDYMSRLNGLFPVATLLECFMAYLVLEIVIFTVKLLTGLWSGLRGKNQFDI